MQIFRNLLLGLHLQYKLNILKKKENWIWRQFQEIVLYRYLLAKGQ